MFDAGWYLAALFLGLAGVWIALLVHEFAHAVPHLLAGRAVEITLGSDDGRTVRVGPLTLTVGTNGLWWTFGFGYFVPEAPGSRRIRAASFLLGPLASLSIVSAFGLVLLEIGTSGPRAFAVEMVCYSELIRTAMTAAPVTYRRGPYAGWDSDGKQFLRLVRS